MARDERWDTKPRSPIQRGALITRIPTKRYDELLHAEHEMAIYMRSIEHVRLYQARHITPLGLDNPFALGWNHQTKVWGDGIAAATEEIGPSDV